MINKMKKVNVFFIAAFVAVSAMFVASCSADEDEIMPSIDVYVQYTGQSSRRVLEDDEIVAPKGTMLIFNISYFMGEKSKLTEVKLSSIIDGRTSVVVDSVFNNSLFKGGTKEEIKVQYITSVGELKETLTVWANAKSGSTNVPKEYSFDIVAQADDPQATYIIRPSTELGGQTHKTLGSFYSISQGKTYTLSGGKDASTFVDFAYINKDGATIAAISDALVTGHTWSSTNSSIDVKNWGTKNATYFVKIDGASTTNEAAVAGWWDTAMESVASATATKTGTLANNDVYAFKTATGAITGAFVIDGTPGAANGSVKFKMIEKVN